MLIYVYIQSYYWIPCFSFSFLHPYYSCFLFLHQIRMHGCFENIHNRKHAYIYKVIKLLFLYSLIECLKIFTWAQIFQITFSPWFNFGRKVQNWHIRIFLLWSSCKNFPPWAVAKSWWVSRVCIKACLCPLPLFCLLSGTVVTFWRGLGTQGIRWFWRATVKLQLPRSLARLANHCRFFLIFLYHIIDSGLGCLGEKRGADRWSITGDSVVEADLGRTQLFAPVFLFLFFSIFDFTNLMFLNILFFLGFGFGYFFIRGIKENTFIL